MLGFLKVCGAGSNPHRSPRLAMTLENLGKNLVLWLVRSSEFLLLWFAELVKGSCRAKAPLLLCEKVRSDREAT